MAKKSNRKQYRQQGRNRIEQSQSLQNRVEDLVTSRYELTSGLQKNTTKLFLYSLSSMHNLAGKASDCHNLSQMLGSESFNSRILDPSIPLKIVINEKGLNPPFVESLTTIDSFLNMNLDHVRNCLDHYGHFDDDLKRTDLLEAVGVNTRGFINDGNSFAKTENSSCSWFR